jgi:hypothetical protein
MIDQDNLNLGNNNNQDMISVVIDQDAGNSSSNNNIGSPLTVIEDTAQNINRETSFASTLSTLSSRTPETISPDDSNECIQKEFNDIHHEESIHLGSNAIPSKSSNDVDKKLCETFRVSSNNVMINSFSQRAFISASSCVPEDSFDSQPDTKGGCLKFLRELFALSRTINYEKRYFIYIKQYYNTLC